LHRVQPIAGKHLDDLRVAATVQHPDSFLEWVSSTPGYADDLSQHLPDMVAGNAVSGNH